MTRLKGAMLTQNEVRITLPLGFVATSITPSTSVSICPPGYPRNHKSRLYHFFRCMFRAAVARSSFGGVALRHVFPFLPTIGQAEATQVARLFKVTQHWAAPEGTESEVSRLPCQEELQGLYRQ